MYHKPLIKFSNIKDRKYIQKVQNVKKIINYKNFRKTCGFKFLRYLTKNLKKVPIMSCIMEILKTIFQYQKS